MRRTICTALSALAVLGLAGTAEARRQPPEAKLAKLLEGRVAGEPSDCIYLPNVRSTQIIRDTAIVYDAGRTIWVNRPENGSSQLDDDDVMVNKLHGSGSELCSIDIVQLRDRTSMTYNGFVDLGKFVPYRKVSAGN